MLGSSLRPSRCVALERVVVVVVAAGSGDGEERRRPKSVLRRSGLEVVVVAGVVAGAGSAERPKRGMVGIGTWFGVLSRTFGVEAWR